MLSARGPHTILVIEDERDIRESLAQALELDGYGVIAAHHGQHALELCRNGPLSPSLILLDLMMPVMTGWEFLEKRATDEPLSRVPVVVVSAHTDQSKAKGAQAFVRKPIDLDVLLSTVRRFLPA